jgi:hypothetical protein
MNKKIPRSHSIAAVSGIAAFLMFIVALILATKYAISFQRWYTTNEYFDWNTMAISNLGVSSLAIPFTIIICIISLAVIYFIVEVKRAYGNAIQLQHGAYLIIIGFVALMIAFLSLLHEPNSIATIAIHFAAAIVYFVFIPIGIMLIGLYFVRINKVQLGYASLILGI